jgi:hypothetical protein
MKFKCLIGFHKYVLTKSSQGHLADWRWPYRDGHGPKITSLTYLCECGKNEVRHMKGWHKFQDLQEVVELKKLLKTKK